MGNKYGLGQVEQEVDEKEREGKNKMPNDRLPLLKGEIFQMRNGPLSLFHLVWAEFHHARRNHRHKTIPNNLILSGT
jgi:hypothetical protein